MEDERGTSSVFKDSVRMAFAKAKKDILTVVDDMNKIKENMIDLRKEIISMKEKMMEMTAKNNPMISTGTSSIGNDRVLNRPEEILIRQYRMHKPAIVKRKLLELVPETGASLFDLYTTLVERERLCGKTTFYRYVKELCDEKSISLLLENGKRILRREMLRETTP